MNRFTKITKRCLVAAALLAGLVVASERSHAATVANFPARSSPNASSCFGFGFAYMRNDCSSTQMLYIPYPLVWSNIYMYPEFNAEGASPANNVGCRARSVSYDGNAVASTPMFYIYEFGPATTVRLGAVYVPPQGSLALECNVSPGGRVNTASVWF